MTTAILTCNCNIENNIGELCSFVNSQLSLIYSRRNWQHAIYRFTVKYADNLNDNNFMATFCFLKF